MAKTIVDKSQQLLRCRFGRHYVREEDAFLAANGMCYCKTHGARVILRSASDMRVGSAPILHMPKVLRRLAVDYVPNGGDSRRGVLGLCSKPSKSCSYRFVVVNQELVGKERVALLCLADSVCV